MTARSVEADLVTANRILANEGFVDAFGHVTVRDPDDRNRMIVSSYQSPALVSEDDLIRMSLDGRIVSDDVEEVYSETVIHRAIYRNRPDVDAVVHGHPDELIPFCVTDVEVKPLTHQAAPFNGGVPTFEAYDDERGRMVVTEDEGERMAENLGDCRAQLLKQHGVNVVGSSVREATVLSMHLAENARRQIDALSIGTPDYFTEPSELIEATVEGTILKPRTIDRAWDYLDDRLSG